MYSYQDQDSSLLEAAIKNGAKGIVIAGTGNGSIPETMNDVVEKAMAAGIPVVLSTRTGNGYTTPKEIGIGSGIFNPTESKGVAGTGIECRSEYGGDTGILRRIAFGAPKRGL